MNYLLDTNVISAQRRKSSNPSVYAWLQERSSDQLYISILTLGEIRAGIENIQKSNPSYALELEIWLSKIKLFYRQRTLPITETVIECWGRLGNCQKQHPIDALIAATALENGLVLVTRNVKHIMTTGVEFFNPWINVP